MSEPDSRPTEELAALLVAAQQGDGDALSRAFVILEGELRSLAADLLARERVGHTLQATALVNEVFLKLRAQRSIGVGEQGSFLAVAARAMRRVLVDHARRRNSEQRDRRRTVPLESLGRESVPLEAAVVDFQRSAIDLLALDEALERLAERDERLCRVVELRFFGGLQPEEAAEAMGTSLRTCERDWTMAKAWLRSQLAS